VIVILEISVALSMGAFIFTSTGKTEYRQQIKTFRLKYIFLAGKIIRTARSVVMKLSEKYPYQEIYEKSPS